MNNPDRPAPPPPGDDDDDDREILPTDGTLICPMCGGESCGVDAGEVFFVCDECGFMW